MLSSAQRVSKSVTFRSVGLRLPGADTTTMRRLGSALIIWPTLEMRLASASEEPPNLQTFNFSILSAWLSIPGFQMALIFYQIFTEIQHLFKNISKSSTGFLLSPQKRINNNLMTKSVFQTSLNQTLCNILKDELSKNTDSIQANANNSMFFYNWLKKWECFFRW